MPAMTRWSVMTFFTRPDCPASTLASAARSSSSASGPSRATRDGPRVGHHRRGHRLLRARLGDVEPAAATEHDPQRDRASHLRRPRGDRVRPAQPAGAGQMQQQMQFGRTVGGRGGAGDRDQVEELAVSAGPGHRPPDQRGGRGIVGGQHVERGDVHRGDGLAGRVLGEERSQRGDLGQLGHGHSLPELARRQASSDRRRRRAAGRGSHGAGFRMHGGNRCYRLLGMTGEGAAR